MRYLLNSPVVTDYGLYRFRGPIPLEEIRSLLRQGFVSAIGHETTALHLSELLGLPVPRNRQAVRLDPGDQAVVFRLLERLPEGTLLDVLALKRLPHEFGLLERLE